MTTFESMGAAVRRSHESNTIDIGGIKSTKEYVVTTVTLPARSRVQARFSAEGIGDKIVKIFKKEIQVGDKTFDDAVYISTSTPAETEALLQSQDVQTTILACVTTGGSIEIKDRTVTFRASGSDASEDPAQVRFVAALLG